jgi:hypothetical protein
MAAVSAMKWTPQKTRIALSVFAASLESPSESPTKCARGAREPRLLGRTSFEHAGRPASPQRRLPQESRLSGVRLILQ